MRAVIGRAGINRSQLRRRTVGVGLVAAAVVAVMIDPGPAQAATIPTPPTNKAVCQPTKTPGNPVATSFARSPSAVNVTASSKKIAFTVKATDSTKNIVSVSVAAASPKIGTVIRSTSATLHRTSGTAKNGTWKGTALIPKWTNNGTWSITGVTLVDAGGGSTFYSSTGAFGSKPFPSGWPKTFKVTSKPDVVGPTFPSVKFTPTSVNTSAKTKTITVTVKAKDAVSGMPSLIFASGGIQIGTTYPNIKFFRTTGGTLTRRAGTSHSGTYKGTITVPRWVTSGTKKWTLSVFAVDLAGNSTQKAKAGSFKVTSKTDATKPALKGLTFSPHAVDATSAPKGKTVAVTLKASDTQSGLSYAFVTFTSPGGYRVSGFGFPGTNTPSSATMKFKVVIPRCSEPGIWTVSVTIVDAAQNVAQYTAAQVKAKHFTSTLSVKALDWQAPGGTIPATVSHNGSVVVTLSEPTLWSGNGSPNPWTVYDNAGFNTVNGTWTCKSTTGTALASCYGSTPVKTASFKPSSDFVTGHKYTVQSYSGIYDTSGNGPAFISATFKAT